MSPEAPLGWTVSHVLGILVRYWRISLSRDIYDAFLMIRWDSWFGRMTREVKCHYHHIVSHHIISRVPTIDMTYQCWCRYRPPAQMFSGFSSAKSCLFLLGLLFFWKEVTGHISRYGAELCSTSLKAEHVAFPFLADLPLSILYFRCYFNEILIHFNF